MYVAPTSYGHTITKRPTQWPAGHATLPTVGDSVATGMIGIDVTLNGRDIEISVAALGGERGKISPPLRSWVPMFDPNYQVLQPFTFRIRWK